MVNPDRIEELRSYSYPFLAGLAGSFHQEALRLHRQGNLSLTRGIDPEVRQAWIACGSGLLPSPHQVALVEDLVKSSR